MTVYRHRNRPKYSDSELQALYAQPYDHTKWPDHVARVEKTIEIGMTLMGEGWYNVADLSCGDGKIAGELQVHQWKALDWAPHLVLGDLTPRYEFCGPIEETVDQIPDVDLFICSETIEHLDDPDLVLRKIRDTSERLLLSTPNCSWPDPNPEHYWSWDNDAVGEMLLSAGWAPDDPINFQYRDESGADIGYNYQIWTAQ